MASDWCWKCVVPHPAGIAHMMQNTEWIGAAKGRELERLVVRGVMKNIITQAGADWMLSLI